MVFASPKKPSRQIFSRQNSPTHFAFLFPLRTTQELLRIIDNDDTVRLYHDANQILFKTENIELISRLSEGSFPDYAAIIPTSFTTEILSESRRIFKRHKTCGGVWAKK